MATWGSTKQWAIPRRALPPRVFATQPPKGSPHDEGKTGVKGRGYVQKKLQMYESALLGWDHRAYTGQVLGARTT